MAASGLATDASAPNLLEPSDRLSRATYHQMAADGEGLLKSRIFPDLWLDVPALLHGEMTTVLATLRRGLDSPASAAFIAAYTN